ncbi:MAG: hypothetical protein WA918_11070 [Erythrobacter sp.]
MRALAIAVVRRVARAARLPIMTIFDTISPERPVSSAPDALGDNV